MKGIAWPALPSSVHAQVLAVEYQLEQTQWWPREKLLAMQLRQLELVLAHAVHTVPFYRNLLGARGKLKRGGLTMEIWRRLPILKRHEIQEAGSAMVSRKIPKDHLPANKVTTSGSTGRPITVASTFVTKTVFEAMKQRYHIWHDRDFSATVADIRIPAGDVARTVDEERERGWLYCYPSGPSHHLDVNEIVSEQFTWLIERDPDYLFTYPSNLAALLRLSEGSGVRPGKLRQVLTGSEVLPQATREACKEIWRVPITESYASVEVGMIALQCPKHVHLHVQAENVLVEILDDMDRPCEPGETGRVVCTPLNNFGTPLIRYEIGDHAQVGEPCSCGRGLPVLTRILGRTRNMAVLPSGDRFWPRFYSDDLASVAPVRQAQLIQKTVHEIEVRLVVARTLSDHEEEQLKSVILEYLGHPFTLNFIYVDEIPRSATGKYEDFMSLVE